jgi:dethiobiotin synthetase
VNPVWLKTPAAPIVGTLMEKVTIDIEQILFAFHALQERVEYVIVEGTGGWLVPIRSDYFVSDLAAAMKLPVLVVAQNRLGCLNHAILTVRSIAAYQLRCLGLVLNSTELASEIAALTNADILRRILNVPLLAGLGESLTELPTDWRLMLGSISEQ